MTQRYPLQIITIDEVARQAVELAGLSRFDRILHGDPATLASQMSEGYRPIVVLSHLDTERAKGLKEALAQAEEPILLLPHSLRESEVLEELLLGGLRIIFAPSNTVSMVALSHALEILESLFYSKEKEGEIDADHRDIYAILAPGTVTEIYASEGTYAPSAMFRLLNTPRNYDDTVGALFLFEVDNQSLEQISEAMAIAEKRLPEDTALLLEVRTGRASSRRTGIVSLISRTYDFLGPLQRRIDASEGCFEKGVEILDAYTRGILDDEGAEYLGELNGIKQGDLRALHRLAYVQPAETVRLIRAISDEKIDTQTKIEFIADMAIEGNVDLDVMEALIAAFGLPMEAIVEMIDLQKEGKLPIDPIELPAELSARYPRLRVAKKSDFLLLLDRNDLHEEKNGLVTIATEAVEAHDSEGSSWYVSKHLDTKQLDTLKDDEQWQRFIAQLIEPS